MIVYSRFVPFQVEPHAMIDTERHVRAHLSSVASPDDDENRYASEVRVEFRTREDGILIYGELDRDPVAPYLDPDFGPEQDVADNPLSVSSIREGQ